MFKKAVKRDAKLRLAFCGPAGSGKTFSSLSIATELASVGGIAYVDTEHGSASKYAHTDKCGGPCACVDPSHFTFDVVEPDSFDPRDLIKFIDFAVENGYKVICIDSLSHYWMGPNGELDLVDATAKREARGNSFAAWKTVTPIHNSLVDKILSAPIHVLVSMRTKTEWVIEKDDRGKNVPRKIGMAPIMRDGIEFEFDVCGDLDQDNNLAITKSRCSELAGKVINRPGRDMARILRSWCAGAQADPGIVSTEYSDGKPGEAQAADGAQTPHMSEEVRGPIPCAGSPSGYKEVDVLWAQAGTKATTIRAVIASLYGDIAELSSVDEADALFTDLKQRFANGGDPSVRVMFARRVILEMWKALDAKKNPQPPLFDNPKETVYAD